MITTSTKKYNLLEASLESLDNISIYTALSYTWGELSNTVTL